MKLSAKQVYYLFVKTVREKKALTLVRSAEKHHGIAAWKRIKTEYQPDAARRHTASWDSCNLVAILECCEHVFETLDEWDRRIQHYEGESLETFQDGRS